MEEVPLDSYNYLHYLYHSAHVGWRPCLKKLLIKKTKREQDNPKSNPQTAFSPPRNVFGLTCLKKTNACMFELEQLTGIRSILEGNQWAT